MKNLILSIGALCLLSATQVHAGGSETHGGDVYALRFVKTARMIVQAMKAHPDWQFSHAVSADELSEIVDRTVVETTDDQKVFVPGTETRAVHLYKGTLPYILIWRMDWMMQNYSCADDFKMVLGQYLSLLNYTDVKIQSIITLFFELDWDSDLKPLCLLPIEDMTRNQIPINKDPQTALHILGEAVVAFFENHSGNSLFKSVDLKKVQAAAETVKFEAIYVPQSLDGQGFFDAINVREDKQMTIRAVPEVFVGGLYGERFEFVFHELLELSGVDERNYPLSSQLFQYLPAEYYDIDYSILH